MAAFRKFAKAPKTHKRIEHSEHLSKIRTGHRAIECDGTKWIQFDQDRNQGRSCMKMIMKIPFQPKRGNVQEWGLRWNLIPGLYTEGRRARFTSLPMNYTHITYMLSLITTSTFKRCSQLRVMFLHTGYLTGSKSYTNTDPFETDNSYHAWFLYTTQRFNKHDRLVSPFLQATQALRESRGIALLWF
jgi:hypothetical protein